MLKKMGLIGAIGLAAAAFAACDSSPLSENRDKVVRFDLNPTFAYVAVGDTTKVTANATNEHNRHTGDAVAATACDNKITVVKDPDRKPVEVPERFLVIGVAAGESCLTVSAGGVQATATIIVVQ
ncbi:MAG: hypothetical protein PVH00_14930 [Gemmatimonadota bacterium]|jgi:uncharacterized protein YjdB